MLIWGVLGRTVETLSCVGDVGNAKVTGEEDEKEGEVQPRHGGTVRE